jgi:NAD+ kinase
MKSHFQTIALIGKYKSPEIADPLLKLADFLASVGLSVVVDKLTDEHLTGHPYSVLTLEEMEDKVDLAIVMGGDGTLLNIARMLAPFDIPLVGVNQGRLGFLTDISIDTMQHTISGMLRGDYVTEKRMLLSASISRGEMPVFESLAFNDVVIHRGNNSSMLEFEVRIDGE